jgi:hypothetical protein
MAMTSRLGENSMHFLAQFNLSLYARIRQQLVSKYLFSRVVCFDEKVNKNVVTEVGKKFIDIACFHSKRHDRHFCLLRVFDGFSTEVRRRSIIEKLLECFANGGMG